MDYNVGPITLKPMKTDKSAKLGECVGCGRQWTGLAAFIEAECGGVTEEMAG